MSQYDFGTIDPYVMDGVGLASALNQWRDAVHSMHRGNVRPAYVVPGMMWVNDGAGPANWIVELYMGPAIGDVAMWHYDTTTGAVVLVGGPYLPLAGGTLTGPLSLGAADPLTWLGRAKLQSTGDGLVSFLNNALTAGVLFDVTTDGVVKARNRANGADATLTALTQAAADSSNKAATTAFVKTAGATATVVSTGKLGASVPFGAVNTYKNGPTTGVIGAAGQKWLLMGTLIVSDVTGTFPTTIFCGLRMSNGAGSELDYTVSCLGGINTPLPVNAIATLTGPTAFTLQAQNLSNGVGAVNGDSSLVAVRLA